jgi:hypothetical protein
MKVLRVLETKILHFKSARSLLLTLFVRAARVLLRPSFLEVGGVGTYYSINRRIIFRAPRRRKLVLIQQVEPEYSDGRRIFFFI